MAALIRSLRPAVTVWFHQPVGVVDESGGSVAVEARFARLLGEPLRRLTRYPGSVSSWQNASFPGTSAFVVELPRKVDAALAARALRALTDVAR
jgi:protein MpaA